MKTLLAALFALTLPACELLKPLEEKAAADVAKGIIVACEQTDESFRLSFVAEVNKNLENTPHMYSSACNKRLETN